MKRSLSLMILFALVVLSSSLFAQDNRINFINDAGTLNVKDTQDFFDNPAAYAGKTITLLACYYYKKANLQDVVGLNVPFSSYMNAAGNTFHSFIKKDLAVPSATYFQLLKVTLYRGDGVGDDVNIALSISKVY